MLIENFYFISTTHIFKNAIPPFSLTKTGGQTRAQYIAIQFKLPIVVRLGLSLIGIFHEDNSTNPTKDQIPMVCFGPISQLEQLEFVRVGAKFGAKTVPFGVIGEDDVGQIT